MITEIRQDAITRLPVIDMAATGKNITRLRENADLSVRDLQNILGFETPQAIYRWQRGLAMPAIDNLIALAVIFGVKLDDIVVVGIMPTSSN